MIFSNPTTFPKKHSYGLKVIGLYEGEKYLGWAFRNRSWRSKTFKNHDHNKPNLERKWWNKQFKTKKIQN